jgi:hypothetical protein
MLDNKISTKQNSKGVRMKTKIVLVTIFLIIGFSNVYSQDKDFGFGVIIGEPTGISAKYWTGSSTAFDAAAAWSFVDEGALHLHADYLFHSFDLINVEKGRLPLYYGLGGKIKLAAKDAEIGARIPVGLSYLVQGAPLDIFFEVVPIMELAPATEFGMNGAIGIRYYFE